MKEAFERLSSSCFISGMNHKRGNDGWMAIKADMEKAYDQVEWAFVLKILEQFGFHPTWFNWVKQCITSSSFSVLLNGGPYGNFVPTRGLRQGDPLSPFLFLLCSEILSRLLLKEEAAGHLRGIKIGQAASVISHLLFADDLLLFGRANISNASAMDRCLETYMSWSGQKINRSKSFIHFSKNFSGSAILPICELLHLKTMPVKAKHLGLPLLIPRSKISALADLKERLFTKLSGWKAKVLSQAGQATLIRSVASSLPAYTLTFFAAPTTWCAEVDKGLKKFWWGFKHDKVRNLTLKSWSSICISKAAGRLGFLAVADFNRALVSKLAWHVATNKQSLWVQLVHSKYLQHSSFEDAVSTPQASWVWKSILKMRPLLKLGACFLVGNGLSISVWNDPWIPSIPGFIPSPHAEYPISTEITMVADLIDPNTGQWNRSLIRDSFSQPQTTAILSIHLQHLDGGDELLWIPDKKLETFL